MNDWPRKAQILADAAIMGDRPAARKWGVSRTSFAAWRAQLETNKELRAAYAALVKAAELDWAELRLSFLREAVKAMKDKLPGATLAEVADATKVIGELHQAAQIVEDGDDPAHETADGHEGPGVEGESAPH